MYSCSLLELPLPSLKLMHSGSVILSPTCILVLVLVAAVAFVSLSFVCVSGVLFFLSETDFRL